MVLRIPRGWKDKVLYTGIKLSNEETRILSRLTEEFVSHSGSGSVKVHVDKQKGIYTIMATVALDHQQWLDAKAEGERFENTLREALHALEVNFEKAKKREEAEKPKQRGDWRVRLRGLAETRV